MQLSLLQRLTLVGVLKLLLGPICRQYIAKHIPVIVTATAATVLTLFHLSQRDLWASHEARAAQNAQGFLQTGHWGVLRLLDGTPDYQKPPLYYWLVAAVAWCRGGAVDEMAVRLPSAVAGWLLVAGLTHWFNRRGRPLAGAIAGLSLLTAGHFLALARTGRIDVPLSAAIAWAVMSHREGRSLRTASAIAMALMLKGPIGLALIIGIALAVDAVTKPRAEFRSGLRRMTFSAALGAALALPWFIYVGFETAWEYWRVFFLHHHFHRASGTSADLARHPSWFYLVRWVVDWLPWTPLLIVGFWNACRHWRQDETVRIGVAWIVAATLLLSISSFKRADYLIPAYPGAAMLLGCIGERLFQASGAAGKRRLRFTAAALSVFIPSAYLGIDALWLARLDAACEKRSSASIIRQRVAPGRQIVLFRVEDHLLAWHLGKPLATVLEWENLDVWVSQLDPGYVVMPAALVAEWSGNLENGTLREVARLPDRMNRERPRDLVLLESHPHGSRCRAPAD